MVLGLSWVFRPKYSSLRFLALFSSVCVCENEERDKEEEEVCIIDIWGGKLAKIPGITITLAGMVLKEKKKNVSSGFSGHHFAVYLKLYRICVLPKWPGSNVMHDSGFWWPVSTYICFICSLVCLDLASLESSCGKKYIVNMKTGLTKMTYSVLILAHFLHYVW